ncbi:MotA/TolQ/ExbB proton channel family protein [Curvibacter sp. APW13]|uniref:MotA/TolQ/ExbB proton channel family protein n=1 Tax=Curvibacter sp. APW13 TaxID=3077236 RepID=UPI0028DE4618|nr:MotA/TolQ/ExbB proton channel family protein [Curvibacter sp. APW13]MDT8990030.1 MotA/TolQ/ExbB proton channel family protein [Curvibacter sp. APW13]
MWQTWLQADTLGRAVIAVLMAMSVGSWCVIVWKAWVLRRASLGLQRAKAALWQASSLDSADADVAHWDKEGLVLPLLAALRQPPVAGLDAANAPAQRRTRLLREALQDVVQQLQSGHTILATVGSVSPFVGLLGTVWGIYHALLGISGTAQLSLDRIAAPVGEALIMTAAGLIVAIPAVVGYNVLGRRAALMEADLEGLALDLRDLTLATEA